MFFKQWLKDVFSFTRTDRIFAAFVTLVIGASLVLPRMLATNTSPLVLQQDSALVLAMDTLEQRQTRKPYYKRQDEDRGYHLESSTSKSFTKGERFPFDPNTTTLQDWQRLGLNVRTSKTILNYVSKGGKFYRPEDLQRIWGLPEGFYEWVKDFIVIHSVEKRDSRQYDNSKPKYEREERKPVFVNVNNADTTALIALPGIGEKLSARIIAFREKLGGFYSVEQIGETYGLPDSTFQKIKGRLQVDANEIRKLNVNTATKDELKTHPYIRWKLANTIVEYRNQHGAFKDLEELKNIVLIDEALYGQLRPYLSL